MWPWILGSAALGGLTGGIQGYQQSGGDLGATLRSAATGSLLGGVTGGIGRGVSGLTSRMAGNALGLTNAQGVTALGKGLLGAAQKGPLSLPASMLLRAPQLAGSAAGVGATLASGALLGPAANAVGNLVGQAGSAAVGAAGAKGVPGLGAQQAPGTYPFTQYAVPSGMGQYGPTPQFNPWNVVDPTGQFAAARLGEEKEQDVQIEGMKKLEAALAPITEGRSKAEFLRQMAAAGIRANILTNQQNMLGGLATARQMGLTGAQQVGQALTQQYQYQ